MTDEIYYDPYDFDIDADPYPVWKRLRDEAPLYYNEKYDFYAVSRFDDVERCSVDWRTYLSGKGSVLEMIKQGIDDPAGQHPVRGSARRTTCTARCSSRVFTPRRIAELEPKVREFCAAQPRPAGGQRRVRLHRRPRRADADAHHRHAARHPRGGPGGHPRPASTRACRLKDGAPPDPSEHVGRHQRRRTSPTTSTGAPSTRPTIS